MSGENKWIMDGQVFVCAGVGYGLDANLNTVCIGTEQTILEAEEVVSYEYDKPGTKPSHTGRGDAVVPG